MFDGDDLVHHDLPQLGPREAAQELLRAKLEAGARRGRTDSADFRALLRIGRIVGLPVVDLQRRTGFARQSVYNALKRPIGDELDDLDVLAMIAAGAAQTVDTAVIATDARPSRVRAALSRLRHADYVDVLGPDRDSADGGPIFSVTAKGLGRLLLEIDSERLRSAHDDAWTVFVAIPESKQTSLERAVEALLGSDGSVGVVEARVAPTRMQGPELAIIVRAPDTREVLFVVQGIWSQLRQKVNGLPALARVVAVSPPNGPFT